MESKFYIKCRTGPVGDDGPLVLRIEQDTGFISAAIAPSSGDSPRGLSIDHVVIFDMQSDGGVDGIEILCPFGMDLSSKRALLHPQERYWRLFLDPSGKDIMAPDVELVMQRLDRFF